MNLNDITNAIATRIDAFEIATGGTVSQLHIDTLKAISAELKELGAPRPELAVIPAAAAPAAHAAPAPTRDELPPPPAESVPERRVPKPSARPSKD